MGLEPTTSSLGISASIAYKGHGVHRGDTDPWSFSNLRPLLPQRILNGGLIEWRRNGHISGSAQKREIDVPALTEVKERRGVQQQQIRGERR